MKDPALSTKNTLEYLSSLGFRNVAFNVKAGDAAETDMIVYAEAQRQRPAIIVEVKTQIPSAPELLHPAVQQAFRSSALLGLKTGYLLVSDGQNYQWFRLKNQGTSIEYSTPPGPRESQPASEDTGTADSLLHLCLTHTFNALRDSGVRIDIRAARDILRIVVAALSSPPRERAPLEDPRPWVTAVLRDRLGKGSRAWRARRSILVWGGGLAYLD